LLEENSSNLVLKRWFELCLNPRINFYQKKRIDAPTGAESGDGALQWAMDCLVADIASRKYTGNAARERITQILSMLDVETQKLVHAILQKKPDCGVDSSVDKVWPGLVPSLPCMLAKPFSSKLAEQFNWQKGVWSELKSDGCRTHIAIKKTGEVELYTRGFNDMTVHGKFDFLGSIPELRGHVIDGELLSVDAKGKFLDRKTANGIANKAVKGTISEEEAARLHLVAWDVIPIDDFWKRGYASPYTARRQKTSEFVKLATAVSPYSLSHIPGKLVYSIEDAQKHFQELRDLGQEGSMLKEQDEPWADIRSTKILKLKEGDEDPADMRCVGFNPGNGKYEGMIGSLVFETDDGKVRVNCSGMTDKMRNEDPGEFVGRIAEIQYNELIRARNSATASLFLPRFNKWRDDKNTTTAAEDFRTISGE